MGFTHLSTISSQRLPCITTLPWDVKDKIVPDALARYLRIQTGVLRDPAYFVIGQIPSVAQEIWGKAHLLA